MTLNNHLLDIFQNHNYRAWSIGNGILTAQSGKFGYIILRYRRPTGTIAWTMKLVNTIYHHRMEDELFQGVSSNDIHEQMHIPYLVQKSPSEPDLKQLSKLKASTSNMEISEILDSTVLMKDFTTKETQDVLDVILAKHVGEPTSSEQQVVEDLIHSTSKKSKQQIDSTSFVENQSKNEYFPLPSYDEDSEQSSLPSLESEPQKKGFSSLLKSLHGKKFY